MSSSEKREIITLYQSENQIQPLQLIRNDFNIKVNQNESIRLMNPDSTPTQCQTYKTSGSKGPDQSENFKQFKDWLMVVYYC